LLVRCLLKDLTGSDDVSAWSEFEKSMELFRQHDWPGNARELRNVVEMGIRGATGSTIDLGAFLTMGRLGASESESGNAEMPDLPFKESKNQLIDHFERKYIQKLLERNDNNISKAAREAQIERAYLQRLVRKHDISTK
jgi:DNA-binding NtrC family response regulator